MRVERGWRKWLDTPPAGVFGGERNNVTPLRRSTSKLGFTCPICFVGFERFAAHAKRVKVSYCSLPCAWKGREVKVETNCVVCNKQMLQNPTLASRVITCSKRCSSVRRRSKDVQPHFRKWAGGIKAVKEMAALGKCRECGRTHGPWAVRGLKFSLVDDELVVDKRDTELWCKDCHLKDVAPLGPPARVAAYGR